MTTVPLSHVHITRRAEARVAIAIEDTRVVLIVGPRQAGKTTLVRRFVTEARPYITLDDAQTLNAARADPVGFVRSLPSAIIDEVQRAPALMLAIKETVDRDTSPGRYLLTGSANVMALPSIGDSLAGRIEIIQLLPLSQAELTGCRFRRDRPGNPIINRPLFRELTGRDSENYPARAGVGSGSCFWMS